MAIFSLYLVVLGPRDRLPTIWEIAYSPQGDRALLRATEQNVAILVEYSSARFRLLNRMNGQGAAFTAMDWNQYGVALIAGRETFGRNLLLLYDGTRLSRIDALVPDDMTFLFVQWSPRGTQALLSGLPNRVYLYDNSTGSLEMVQRPSGLAAGSLFAASWRPDGGEAILVGDDILRYDPSISELIAFPSGGVRFRDVDWSPDAREAILVGEGGSIFSYDGTSIRQLWFVAPSVAGYEIILENTAWAPDGHGALILGLEGNKPPAGSSEWQYAEVIAFYDGSLTFLSARGPSLAFHAGQGSTAQARWNATGTDAAAIVGRSLYEVRGLNATQTFSSNIDLFGIDVSPPTGDRLIGGTELHVFRVSEGSVTDLTPSLTALV